MKWHLIFNTVIIIMIGTWMDGASGGFRGGGGGEGTPGPCPMPPLWNIFVQLPPPFGTCATLDAGGAPEKKKSWIRPWMEEGKWMWGKQRMKINHCYLFMTDLHMWLAHTAYFLKVQTKSGNWCRCCVRGIRSLQWVRDVSGELKCLW